MNNVFPKTFAYGQARGNFTVDFVLSSPWWLKLLFDPSGTFPTGASPFTYNYAVVDKIINPFTTEIGFDGDAVDTIRFAQGCVMNSVSMRASVGELVRCAADIQYSIETKSATLDTTPAVDDILFPYTFAHASLEFPDGTVIAEIQDMDLTFNQNPELLFGIGANQGVGAYRKLFEITGRFRPSFVDTTQLDKFYAQIGINSVTELREQPTLTIKFDNGQAGAAQRLITVTATAIGLDTESLSIEPNEPIFEDISWQLAGCTVAALNNTSSEP